MFTGICTVEPLLFISLHQVPQQRESTDYWCRNSLKVVTARVFYLISGLFYISTINVRVEGTSALRDMRARRSTPPNVAGQRN